MQGLAASTQVLTASTQGLTASTQGLTASTQGLNSSTQGLTMSNFSLRDRSPLLTSFLSPQISGAQVADRWKSSSESSRTSLAELCHQNMVPVQGAVQAAHTEGAFAALPGECQEEHNLSTCGPWQRVNQKTALNRLRVTSPPPLKLI